MNRLVSLTILLSAAILAAFREDGDPQVTGKDMSPYAPRWSLSASELRCHARDPSQGVVVRFYRHETIARFDEDGRPSGQFETAGLPTCTDEAAVLGWNRSYDLIELSYKDNPIWIKNSDVQLYPSASTGFPLSGIIAHMLPRENVDIQLLPWPPPKPASISDLSEQILLKGSYGKVDEQLRGHLYPRGYEDLHYFSVPNGFAVATNPERISGDGWPIENRWIVSRVGGWHGIFDYLQNLAEGEQTRFRVFLIVVSSEDFTPQNFSLTEQDVERWRAFGRPALSEQLALSKIASGTRVWLMTYEFQANRGKGDRLLATPDATVSSGFHRRALGFK